jgi:predicted dehydrogenase
VQEDQLRLHGIRPGDKSFGVEPESHHGTLTTVAYEKATPVKKTYPTVEPATYVEYYKTFAKALNGQGDVPVAPTDARDVLRLLELALQSSKEGRTIEV